MYSYFTFLELVKAISVHRAHRLLPKATLILCTWRNRLSVTVSEPESVNHETMLQIAKVQRFNLAELQVANRKPTPGGNFSPAGGLGLLLLTPKGGQ